MLFIAEIGLNHNGNLPLAYELIRQAKWAGADIAKFQLGWRGGEGEMNAIDEHGLAELMQWCDYFDIEFMVSVFTPTAWEMVRHRGCRRYKVASRTVRDDPALVESILEAGNETFVSLGMWEGPGLPFEHENARYLWCKSTYPATPWDMTRLPKSFGDSPFIGYSDHTIGIEVPLMAISRGAKVVEKHFTLDKSDTTIRDHALSASPEEFRTLVNLGRNIAKNLEIGV